MQKNVKNSKSPKRVPTQTSPSQKKSTTQQNKNTKNSSQNVNPSMLDKTIAFIKNSKEQTKTSAKKTSEGTTSGSIHYTQDIMGIRQIRGGMVCMTDGSVIGIQEIIPINFYQKTVFERNFISGTFQSFFRISPEKLHFKMRTEKADVEKVIRHIKESNKGELSKKVLRHADNYIEHIRNLQNKDSLCKRFYIIYEYEGVDGKKSNDINQIYRSMEETRLHIQNIFASMGHLVVVPSDVNVHVCELLYKYFNPITSTKESFEQRFARIAMDAKRYNFGLPKENQKEIYEDDFIAPKGIKRKSNYIVMDGMYHTYITIKDIGHPSRVFTGWTDLLCTGLGYDVDILAKKLSHDTTVSAIEQMNRWGRVYSNKKINNPEKYKELSKGIANKNFVTSKMRDADEDLWNVMIIITIRANSYQNMMQKKNTLVKTLQSKTIYTEDSFLVAYRNFKMTMPFLYFDKNLFQKNKRNYLTSSMASLYNMTAYELFNENGVVMGINARNNSLVAIDVFDTSMYSNANISLFGGSGSGKTFTELMLAYRMRLTGMRTFFILPVKGYEYAPAVTSLGGEVVNLYPGGKTCINIMQIRPEAEIDKDALSEDVVVEKASLLSKKISSLTVFLQLLMKTDSLSVVEVNRLNSVITEVYSRFGVTNDNDSIYRNKQRKVVKEMPLLQDLYDALQRDELLERIANILLPFIEGSCQNFNANTNINLNNRCIAFDIDEDIVGEEFLPAFLYIAFDFTYDMVKQDKLSKDVIFLDEAWKMMENDACAKQIRKLVKLIRGYAGSVVISTQDIEDFIEQKNGLGKAIVSNTEIKILLKMKEAEIKAVAEVIDLSTEDMMLMKKFKKGSGYIHANGDKVLTQFKASSLEERLFTTDVNVKQRIKMEDVTKKKTFP